MDDNEAHKVIRDLLDQKVEASRQANKRLREERAEFDEDPHPLTDHIIKRTEEKIARLDRESEALAIAASKF
jgi:hypothetical protein